MSENLVIIIIIAHKSAMTPLEEISLRQCFKILKGYPIHLVCPSGLNIQAYQRIIPDIEADFIDPKWQASYQQFARLKIEPFLYKRYQKYRFILFYELDAFVFRNDLEYWCRKNYDYIGAPWFEGYKDVSPGKRFIGVGNGGFSLRKVDSALRVLRSFSFINKPRQLIRAHESKSAVTRILNLARDLTVANNYFFLFNSYDGAEDIFWGILAKRDFPWFKVAPIEEAIAFSFELQPRILYEMNNKELPFGCHAWWKYDIDFWGPFIEKEGYHFEHKTDFNKS